MTNRLEHEATAHERREQVGEPPSLFVPVLTAARMLGIGRTKVYELVGEGELEMDRRDRGRTVGVIPTG